MGILSQSGYKIQNYLAHKKEIAHQRLLSLCRVKRLSWGNIHLKHIYVSVLCISTTITSEGQAAKADLSCIFPPRGHQNSYQGSYTFSGLSLAALCTSLLTSKTTCPLHPTHTVPSASQEWVRKRGASRHCGSAEAPCNIDITHTCWKTKGQLQPSAALHFQAKPESEFGHAAQ